MALYPTYDWLQNKLGGRKSLSATVLVILGLALTLGPVAAAASATVDLGSDLAERATSGDLKVPPAPEELKDIPVIGPKIAEVWTLFERNLDGALAMHGSQILEVSKTLFGKILGVGLLAMALSVIIVGALLSPGPRLQKASKGLQTECLLPAVENSFFWQAPQFAVSQKASLELPQYRRLRLDTFRDFWNFLCANPCLDMPNPVNYSGWP